MPTFASFGGSAIFGYAVSTQTVINPSADQVNAFFGVNGMESLFGGTRGRVTLVEGVLLGSSLANLTAAEEVFPTYNDGIGRTLVDTRGVSYPSVLFKAFEPVGKVRQTLDGIFFRPYKAVFNHLP